MYCSRVLSRFINLCANRLQGRLFHNRDIEEAIDYDKLCRGRARKSLMSDETNPDQSRYAANLIAHAELEF